MAFLLRYDPQLKHTAVKKFRSGTLKKKKKTAHITVARNSKLNFGLLH